MSRPSWPGEEAYRAAFRRLNGFDPYDYQVCLAERLAAGRSVVLRAPTGAGKTRAVLTPFLAADLPWPGRPTRLIYALPLRSLVQQVHAEAGRLLERAGHSPSEATIQTGEQPDDEFFDRGRIIVTTYDQVLSGLLCAPYGLSRSQRTINAGAVAGALLVFDEFHLMGTRTALPTGAALLRLFTDLTISVWMTATATRETVDRLAGALDCAELSLTPKELKALPIIARTRRSLARIDAPLTAEAVRKHARGRTIVIVNTVDRAQALYQELAPWAAKRGVPISCLHARFFKPGRDARTAALRSWFGPKSKGRAAILIATQVIEAGMDLSADVLLSELCPMNALLQRAGRCARFPDETGVVLVFSLPPEENSHLPYGEPGTPDPALAATDAVLRRRESWEMHPELVEEWVQEVHGSTDAAVLEQVSHHARGAEVRQTILTSLTMGNPGGVAHLIREADDDQVRVIIAPADALPPSPAHREAVRISRWALRRVLVPGRPAVAWLWDLGADQPSWREVGSAHDLALAQVVCLTPAIAGYQEDLGLRLGEPGTAVSPPRDPPPRPGHRPLHREGWLAHTQAVAYQVLARWERECAGLAAVGMERRYGLRPDVVGEVIRACALLHDLGKLQRRWQDWANRYERARDPSWNGGEPLAHTNFNPDDPADHARARGITPGRGPHAAASAWYGTVCLRHLLRMVPTERYEGVASACLAAVVAHHGGWIPTGGALPLDDLVAGWEEWAEQAIGQRPDPRVVTALQRERDPRGALERLLARTVSPQGLEAWFGLVAFLVRILRLSDWNATSEGGEI
jgi:CRISPR-associated endonuclease/helicase Cas3